MRSADSGDLSLNTAVVVPAVLLVGLLLIFAGRLALAHSAVKDAAHEAARTASISRSQPEAIERSRHTAISALENSILDCSATNVRVDASAFEVPQGSDGIVTVDVQCTVRLSSVGLPGAPGSIDLTATGRSVIDTYRER